MDFVQESALQTPVKVEVLELENNCSTNEELHQLNINRNIKYEGSNVDSCITKCENDGSKDILEDELITKDHIEPLQPMASIDQQAKIKSRECKYPNCGKSFRTNFELNEHVVIHSDARPFKCEVTGCNKTFKRKRDVKTHMLMHSDYKPFKCIEEDCGKTFKTARTLRNHNNSYHNKNCNEELQDKTEFYICEHNNCGKTFKTIYLLNNHAVVHSDERPFACEQGNCNKAFKRKYELDVHMLKHSDDKPFMCLFDGCGKSFKARQNMRVHMRLHSGATPFKCWHEGCGKVFANESYLASHQNVHGPETVACDYPNCKAIFRSKRSLNVHKLKHKFGKRYSCSFDQCKSAFYRKANLQRHMNEVHKPSGKKSLKNEDTSSNSKRGVEEYSKLGIVHQSSSSQDSSSEEMEIQEKDESCGKYSNFEFVGVEKMEPDNVTVIVKSECENIE